MKILFQAPFLSPTWKGYLANQLLVSLSKLNISTISLISVLIDVQLGPNIVCSIFVFSHVFKFSGNSE